MSGSVKKRIRCAVYTRKSSEEGLNQDYNSIDAQRDAGHTYIASQRAEGWILVADDYDDGGYSGGNMERPALRRLMVDVEAGRVDVVVIYKIDRLTRSDRWLAILESGEVKTLRELAVREGVDNSYVSRMINLTMLSPYVVAAILDDILPDHITLLELAVDPPWVWEDAACYAPVQPVHSPSLPHPFRIPICKG